MARTESLTTKAQRPALPRRIIPQAVPTTDPMIVEIGARRIAVQAPAMNARVYGAKGLKSQSYMERVAFNGGADRSRAPSASSRNTRTSSIGRPADARYRQRAALRLRCSRIG